jgi:RNA polymerase sigma-70 factor, ECF subfamily
LFREHNQELCKLACNIVADPEAAKDIVQEVFVNLWKNRHRVTFGEQIRHYLFKATSNTALTYLRSVKRFHRLEMNDDVRNLQAPAGSESVAYTEFEKEVRKAIDKLPPKCKVIYLLCRHEGLKYQEIADTLDLSLKTVENQMGIALEKLRNELKPFLTLDFLAYLLTAGLVSYYLLAF